MLFAETSCVDAFVLSFHGNNVELNDRGTNNQAPLTSHVVNQAINKFLKENTRRVPEGTLAISIVIFKADLQAHLLCSPDRFDIIILYVLHHLKRSEYFMLSFHRAYVHLLRQQKL